MMGYRSLLLTLSVYSLLSNIQIEGNSQDYCSWEAFSPSCSEDEVLVIDKALYGLMARGRCVDEGYSQYIGCSADLQGYLDRECSGLRSCQLDVHNKDMKDSIQGTCPEPYLEVTYRCQKVIHWKTRCSSSVTSVAGHPGTSYIASLVTKETTCGQSSSPLVLSAEPGQTLNLTLWDFSWSSRSPWQPEDECHLLLYGHIFDVAKDDVVTICGGGIRVKQVYMSTSHQVQIVLNEDVVEEYQFLLEYEVLGCPDPVPPKNSWTTKSGDVLTIGCHGNSDSWQLKCVRGHWIGTTGNCTQATAPLKKVEIKEEEEFNGNHVLAFGLGCAALVICCVTVTLGVFCIKRYKVKLEANYHKATTSDMYMVPTNTSNWQNVPTNNRTHPHNTAEGTLIRQADHTLGLGSDAVPAYANMTIPGILHNRETLLIDRTRTGTLLHGSETGGRETLDRQVDNDQNTVKYFVLEKPPGYNNN